MHTSEAKAILTCLFARLDSEEGNREMVEMEVCDTQGPEQGTLYFMVNCKYLKWRYVRCPCFGLL